MSDPKWLVEAKAAKDRMDKARALVGAAADERALWISRGVDEVGRKQAAAMLQISIGQVDKAIARARGLARPTGLPAEEEILRRLYELEMPQITEPERRVLAAIVRSTFLDPVWVEQPGELLAQEVETLDPDELPAGAEQAVLAEKCRSWSRIQALAVLDAMTTGAADAAQQEQGEIA